MGNNRKALVTGGTGFIGSHLIEALLQAGWEVRCLSRETSSRQFLPRDKIEIVIGDLGDRDSLKKSLDGVNTVFHLAGRIKGRRRKDFFDTNRRGTKNLLESVRECANDLSRFIYVSSLSAAGPSPDGHLLTEDDGARPVSFYGESKLAAERETARFRDDFPIVVLRPAAVYGPRDTETLRVIKLAGWGLRFQPGRADNRFSAVHVTDLVTAILLAAENPGRGLHTYFIGDGKEYTWKETFDILASLLERKTIKLTVPWASARATVHLLARLFPRSPAGFALDKLREMRHNYWVCDVSRAREELGFNPRYDLRSGLSETIRWYRTEGWL